MTEPTVVLVQERTMFRHGTSIRLIAVCAALSVLWGCKHPPAAAKTDPLNVQKYPQISALEKLDRAIVISKVIEDKGPPLAVTVVCRNIGDDQERHVQYRFFFFDEAGKPEEADPDWQYVHMPARTYVYLRGNALDANCVDWKLEIRPAR